MSDADDHTAPEGDGDEMLAAEYVVGVLGLEERLEAERRARAEPAFADRIAGWEERLAPLNAGYPEVAPRNLFPAIEIGLFGRVSGNGRRGWRYFGGLVGGAALAAVLAVAFLVTQPAPQTGPRYNATLQAAGAALVFEASYDPAKHVLSITRSAGPEAGAGRDYELWKVGGNGVPVPIGVLSRPSFSRDVPDLAPGMTLAVSLEPAGGSPNGAPTTVLVSGVISAPTGQ